MSIRRTVAALRAALNPPVSAARERLKAFLVAQGWLEPDAPAPPVEGLGEWLALGFNQTGEPPREQEPNNPTRGGFRGGEPPC